LPDIAALGDLSYYDIKLVDAGPHKRHTGAGNAVILENFALLCALPGGADKITVRVPCIPGINDGADQIAAVARLAREHGVKSVELMPYNAAADAKYAWLGRPYPLPGLEPRPQAYYDDLNAVIADII
jgi:pyruvate formate lyase activating enzyme